MRLRSRSLIFVFAMALAAAGSLDAGEYLRTGGNPIRWNRDRVILKVPRTVHLPIGSQGGVHPSESAGQVHAALWEAARAWNRAERASIKWELELTDEERIGGSSNLVTFTDTRPFDTGQCDRARYLACTLLSHSPDGTALGVNIAFNPYKTHSSTGILGTHDIGMVMMHELGHALGLDHSPMLDSIMNAKVEQEPVPGAPPDFAIRSLSDDDVRTLEAHYPRERLATIEGTVRRNLAAVSGAHVFAIDVEGHPMHGVVTGLEGRFLLTLPPGEYRLAAEPLDGPVGASDLQSAAGREGVSLPTVFWTVSGGDTPDGDSVLVGAGEARTGIDFAIPAGDAQANIETVGVIQNNAYWGFSRVAVARGSTYTLGMTRAAPFGASSVAVPRSKVEIDGAASAPAGLPQLVRQKVKLPADTPCGSYVVQYTGPNAGTSLLAGGLRVVANPVIETAGSGDSPLVAGQAFVIRGKDLACRTVTAEPAYEGAPWPTQLDGVSVKIGDRFARIAAVSPSEIVAEVPESVAGPTTELAVLTGTGMQSPAVNLRIGPPPAQQ